MTRVDRRDPDKTYHKMSRAELRALTPNWSWEGYFQEIGYTQYRFRRRGRAEIFRGREPGDSRKRRSTTGRRISAGTCEFRRAVAFRAVCGREFQFQRAHSSGHQGIAAALEALRHGHRPPARRSARTDLRAEIFSARGQGPRAGNGEQPDRRAARRSADAAVDEPGNAKQALAKLAAFTLKIGYPDKWRDYSAYQVDRGSYVLNQMRGAQFEFKRDLNKIGKPVDRTEWDMSPPTVNAYYNPEMNEIVFPAGILQPPFFDPKADDASNYGGIGAVIGHEMTHGFDDEGRKFDAQGNLRDWWTPEDAEEFRRARRSASKNSSTATWSQDDMHENGKLVLGESIADLGGLNIAYRALAEEPEGKNAASIGGFTPDQRFFLAFAQIWAANDRPENSSACW